MTGGMSESKLGFDKDDIFRLTTALILLRTKRLQILQPVRGALQLY